MITMLRWFDQYFNCLSVKTDTNKNRFNLTYSEGSKAYKTQLAAAWLPMWLNHCEFDVIWTAFQGFSEFTYSHFSILGFWWISVISKFSFLGIGFITDTRKSWKIIIFCFTTLQCMWICASTTILTVWMLNWHKQKQAQFNIFRGVKSF